MTSADTDLAGTGGCLHRARDAAYWDRWKTQDEVISILASIARTADRPEYGPGGVTPTQDGSWPDTAVDLLACCLKYRGAQVLSRFSAWNAASRASLTLSGRAARRTQAPNDAALHLIAELRRGHTALYAGFLTSCTEGMADA